MIKPQALQARKERLALRRVMYMTKHQAVQFHENHDALDALMCSQLVTLLVEDIIVMMVSYSACLWSAENSYYSEVNVEIKFVSYK